MPVFCGSAFKNKGVQSILDGVIDFLPAPVDVGLYRKLPTKKKSLIK